MAFEFKSGVIQSKSDSRDFIYGQMFGAESLPDEFYLPELPVKDQGKFGTCVGNTMAEIKENQEYEERGGFIEMSPLFDYSECKRIDGIKGEGTDLKTSMQVLQKVGSVREADLPYSLLKDATIPYDPTPADLYDKAKEFVIGAYAKTQTIAEIQSAIYNERSPVSAAALVTDNFVHCEGNGFINVPHGFLLGGHNFPITGWNNKLTYKFSDGTTRKGFFRFKNHWTTSWGDKGYGWLSYDFVNYRDIDLGMAYFQEAWSTVDTVLPPKSAHEIIMTIGSEKVIVDGVETTIDQGPIIQNGRTLAPVRFMAEKLGWTVTYDSVLRKVTLRK